MATTHWTGRGKSVGWSDAGNWSAGVPSAGVNAAFGSGDAGPVALAGATEPLSAGTLSLRAGTLALANGLLDLAPEPAQSGNTNDLVLAQGAHLTIGPRAKLSGSNVAQIGNGTGATLTLFGTVAEGYGVVREGTLDVSGPRGHWASGDSGLFFQNATLVVEKGAHVDAGGKLARYPAAALDLEGDSSGLVTGPGSTVRLANVFVSQSFGTSALTVQDGGRVFSGGGDIGGNGDGSLTVTGSGSLFVASRGLRVGGQVPVNSKIVVENGGTVKIGQLGLLLDGTLELDASATFRAPNIISGGGTIKALAGDVVLSSGLKLSDNDSDPFETRTTYLEAAQGATLTLKGAISSIIPNDTSTTLDAASGHIVLAHANGNFAGKTAIYGATLEIAVAGAAGTGGLAFVGGGTPAVLQIDKGLPFQNTISGFGQADKIDLAGFSDQGAVANWSSGDAGGILTLTNAAHQHQALSFAGTDLSAASFGVLSDGHGGTALIHN